MTDAWRAGLIAQREAREHSAERLIQGWAFVLLLATVLYVFIGPAPYQHAISVDADTGDTTLSPINRYVWLLLACLAAPLIWLRRHLLKSTLLRAWPLLALIFWFALTTRWALDPGASNRRFFVFLITLMIGLALAVGFNSVKRMHRAMAITCAVMIGIDLFSAVAMWGKSITPLGLAAIHTHKNVMGSVMLMCGIMVAPYIATQQRWSGRLLWIGIMLACVAMLVLTQSKTSMAILAMVLVTMPLVLLILRIRGGVFTAVGAVLLLTLLAALMLWLAWCSLNARDPLGPLKGITFTQRTDIWAFVFQEIVKHPVRGAGFGSFWDVNAQLQPSLKSDMWFNSKALINQAHNGYLDLLVTTGIVGLLGALFVLFRWIGQGVSMLREALRSFDPYMNARVPAYTAFGLFPGIIFAHNFMESSLFMANALFGSMIVIIGMTLEAEFGRLRRDGEPATADE